MAKSKREIRVVILLTTAEKRNLDRYAKKKDKHVTEVIRESMSRVTSPRA